MASLSRRRGAAQSTAVSKALGLADEASKQAAERQHDRLTLTLTLPLTLTLTLTR